MKWSISASLIALFATALWQVDGQAATSGEQLWHSQRWQYTIAFPKDWSKPRSAGPGILSPGVDVYSQSDHGASTAVFGYSFRKSRSIGELAQEVLKGYTGRGLDTLLLESKDYTASGNDCRRLVFKFGGGDKFISYYTIIFTPRMELVISQNTPERSYNLDKGVFARIVESLSFSAGTEQLPVGTENKWVSKAWGYSVTFPKSWFAFEKDTSQESGPTDITCSSWWGSSIYVFAYPINPRETLDMVSSGIISSYQKRSESFRIEESQDYEKAGRKCRTIVFRWKPVGEQEHIGNYTFLRSSEIMLLVSGESASSNYELDKADYKDVVDSIEIN